MAFLVSGGFCGEISPRKVGLSDIHTLKRHSHVFQGYGVMPARHVILPSSLQGAISKHAINPLITAGRDSLSVFAELNLPAGWATLI